MESAQNPNAKSPFYHHYLRNVTCKGDENKFIWCNHAGWYRQSCYHDAVVVCVGAATVRPTHGYYLAGGLLALLVIGIVVGVLVFWFKHSWGKRGQRLWTKCIKVSKR